MGTPAISVLPAYIFILHFELRLMRVFYDFAVIRQGATLSLRGRLADRHKNYH